MQTEFVQFDEASHVYTRNGLARPSVTKVISDLSLAPPYPEDDPKGKKPLGTAVHRAADLVVHDRLDLRNTDARIQPYMDGLLEKKKEFRIQPIKTELRVFHDHMGYAGTLDLLCLIFDGEPAIFDYKSGAPPPCVELQLCGYVLALEWMAKHGFLEKGAWTALRPRRFSMQLTPGRAVVRECSDDHDYDAWRAAVTLWKWKKDRRK